MSTSPEPATRSRSAVPAGHPAHLLRELVRRELYLSAVFEPYEREERASRPIDGRRPSSSARSLLRHELPGTRRCRP